MMKKRSFLNKMQFVRAPTRRGYISGRVAQRARRWARSIVRSRTIPGASRARRRLAASRQRRRFIQTRAVRRTVRRHSTRGLNRVRNIHRRQLGLRYRRR